MNQEIPESVLKRAKAMWVEYHLNSIRLALLREGLGGVRAEDSSMQRRAVEALRAELGWSDAEIRERATT